MNLRLRKQQQTWELWDKRTDIPWNPAMVLLNLGIAGRIGRKNRRKRVRILIFGWSSKSKLFLRRSHGGRGNPLVFWSAMYLGIDDITIIPMDLWSFGKIVSEFQKGLFRHDSDLYGVYNWHWVTCDYAIINHQWCTINSAKNCLKKYNNNNNKYGQNNYYNLPHFLLTKLQFTT